jgi:hypothetical protein
MRPCGVRWACGSAARLGCSVVDNKDEGGGEGYSKGDDEQGRAAHLLVAGLTRSRTGPE